MTRELRALHVAAGRLAGRDRTCGKKIAYEFEGSALNAAFAMNHKPTTRKTLEAYPCAFCEKWHVGRQMSVEELRTAVAASEETQ